MSLGGNAEIWPRLLWFGYGGTGFGYGVHGPQGVCTSIAQIPIKLKLPIKPQEAQDGDGTSFATCRQVGSLSLIFLHPLNPNLKKNYPCFIPSQL